MIQRGVQGEHGRHEEVRGAFSEQVNGRIKFHTYVVRQ
jgi:hypothetical protein